jgi:hypothetical protein
MSGNLINLKKIIMMTLKFVSQNRVIETTIKKNIISNNLTEIEVVTTDELLSNQLGSPIFLKDENGTVSFKDPVLQSKNEMANDFLAGFSRTLRWAEIKQA